MSRFPEPIYSTKSACHLVPSTRSTRSRSTATKPSNDETPESSLATTRSSSETPAPGMKRIPGEVRKIADYNAPPKSSNSSPEPGSIRPRAVRGLSNPSPGSLLASPKPPPKLPKDLRDIADFLPLPFSSRSSPEPSPRRRRVIQASRDVNDPSMSSTSTPESGSRRKRDAGKERGSNMTPAVSDSPKPGPKRKRSTISLPPRQSRSKSTGEEHVAQIETSAASKVLAPTEEIAGDSPTPKTVSGLGDPASAPSSHKVAPKRTRLAKAAKAEVLSHPAGVDAAADIQKESNLQRELDVEKRADQKQQKKQPVQKEPSVQRVTNDEKDHDVRIESADRLKPIPFGREKFEDSRMWSRLASATPFESQNGSELPPKFMTEHVLPKYKPAEDPNAFGGTGVPIRGGLYDEDDELLISASVQMGNGDNDDDNRGLASTSGNKSKRPRKSKHPKAELPTSAPKSQREKNQAAFDRGTERADNLYSKWLESQSQINRLLQSSGYSGNASVSRQGNTPRRGQISRKGKPPPEDQPRRDVPDGFNMHIDKHGLHVFSPTADVYRDFETFLEVVEELAGREKGVVKVVVPKESLEPWVWEASAHDHTDQNESSREKINTYSLQLALNQYSKGNRTTFYEVVSEEAKKVPAKDWHNVVLEYENLDPENLTLQDKSLYCGTEREMLARFGRLNNECLYAMDNDATPGLRRALQCSDPHLISLPGNSLNASDTLIPGIHTPYFYVSRHAGTPFALHIEDFAAYSLNYMHSGAPKHWLVVRPADHHALEEWAHEFLNPTQILLGNPLWTDTRILPHKRKLRHPPPCAQFLRHHALYVPAATLDTLQVQYTRVEQAPGEMVVTFPFAYHEGWNAGPNIAEAVGYASKRWEVFVGGRGGVPGREGDALLKSCRRTAGRGGGEVCGREGLKIRWDFAGG
ncbi:MAG: hypothetical protein M1819_000951 [Sarea resinae]|nr:MAG: hypothetical protein M1819_000951 [Sarea resinae]